MRIITGRGIATGFSLTFGAALAVALAYTVASISTVLMSMTLAVFLALVMEPVVRAISRRGVPQGWSVAFVAIAFLMVVAVIVVVVVPTTVRQLSQAVQGAPEALESLTSSAWFLALEDLLDVDAEAIIEQMFAAAASPESLLAISGGVLRVGMDTVGAISNATIVVVLTLYFVSSFEAIKRAAASLVPAYRRERFSRLLDQITGSVGRVLAGGVSLSVINASVVFVLQLLIGSDVAALMAIIAFFITLVPVIGSVVFLFVGTLGALFVSPTAAVIFALGYLVYIQLEAYVVTPRVMGRAVDVPGVLIIIGALVGAALLGLLGALLAIPVTASILIIIREVIIPRSDAQLRAPTSP